METEQRELQLHVGEDACGIRLIGEHDVRFGGAEGALTIRLGTRPTGLLVSWQARIARGPHDGVIGAFLDFDPEDARKRLQELLSPRDSRAGYISPVQNTASFGPPSRSRRGAACLR